MTTSGTLLVIDGHSMAFRAFHALPVEGFTNSTGVATNAVYGFVQMLLRLLGEQHPTHVVTTFDHSKHSFRKREYPEYKEGRKPTPEEFKPQIPMIRRLLEAMSIPVVIVEDVEADDVLATFAARAREAGMEVLLATGDRDSFQLVNDHVRVLYPQKSMSDLRVIGVSDVEEKYGVLPSRYPELAAIVGEKADNLPGVPGIGDKIAAKLLNDYDGLDNLLARREELTGKRGQALRDHVDAIERNRRLNRLLTDVELPVSVEQTRRRAMDRVAITALCDEFEFGAIRGRIIAQDVSGDPDDGEEASDRRPLVNLSSIEVTTGDEQPIAGWFDTLGEGLCTIVATPHDTDPHYLTFATLDRALVIDLDTLDDAGERSLDRILGGGARLVTHDAKALGHQLYQRNLPVVTPVFDTQLADYLVNSAFGNYALTDSIERHLHMPNTDTVADDLFVAFDPTPMVAQAVAVRMLADILSERVSGNGAEALLRDVELPVQTILGQMERAGIGVDVEALTRLRHEFAERTERVQQQAFDVIGRQINLSSPKQLQEVLFGELDMPKTKKTKRGYTTNAEALTTLYEKTGHPFLGYLLEHREQIKLMQIVDGLLQATQPDRRIHTTFLQTKAGTGRLSSVAPNLQNIPARSDAGLEIRGGFVPGEKYDLLMSADYSQIEMRVMAALSGDPDLIAAFSSGEDLHRTIAAMVFQIPVEDVDASLRSRIKATSYGLAYGLSEFGLSTQLDISVGEARELRNRYFERFGGVQRFLRSLVDEARQRGYTETIMGRRRYLPELISTNGRIRAEAERAALNAPIQGSAADIMKLAMIDVDRALRDAALRSRILLQVHDELILEVVADEVETVRELVVDRMTHAVDLGVELDVAVGIGTSWKDAAH